MADEIDREGFGSVYERYYSRLVRYCARLASPQIAQEVAQETMTRALGSLDRFDLSRPLWPWLKTIAINLVHDMGRRAGREIPAAEPWPADSYDGMQAVEDRALLEMALARLSARQRTAIGLRYLLGWEPVHIASHFGLSPSAARQLLSRARTRLRIEFRRLADAPFGFLLAPWAALRRTTRALLRLPAHLDDAVSTALSAPAAHAFLTGVVGLALVFSGGTPGLGHRTATAAPGSTDLPAHLAPRLVGSRLEQPPIRRAPAASEGVTPMPAASSVESAEPEPRPAPEDSTSNEAGPQVPPPAPPPPSTPPAPPPPKQPQAEQPHVEVPGPVQLRPFP